MIKQIQGVIPVVHTPFLENGEMDKDSLYRQLDWACSLEIGRICTGMVSELLRLSNGNATRYIEYRSIRSWRSVVYS